MTPGGLEKCELCPRRCGVNRLSGDRGYCGAGATAEVFRYGPHNGEEPPLSGSRGSGTIFFSRCTLKCFYCQNHPWSQEGAGEIFDSQQLQQAFRSLYDHGCHNWNLVSPTPWLPQIREAARELKKAGIHLPMVYNTSGFERIETLEEFRETGDIFLADLRYAKPGTALEGSGSADYVKIARAALKTMFSLTGPMRLDGNGIALSGTICRILILPGKADEAVESLRWVAATFGNGIAVSVMSQYYPAFKAKARKGWNRRITEREHELVTGEVEKLGLAGGWVQEMCEDKDGAGRATESDLLGFRMKKGAFQT